MAIHYYRAHLLLFIIAFSVLPKVVYAAGFDCSRASSRTEKLICHDETLSMADSLLNQMHRKAFEDPLIDLKSLKTYVNQFIASRDRCTRDADDILDCLAQQYDAGMATYRSLPHSVDVDSFELNRSIGVDWQKISVPVEDEAWPYLISIYMPSNSNGLWHESQAYLVVQDRLTEITMQVIYLPNLSLSLDESKVSTARVDYNETISKMHARIENPDKDGHFAITLTCGDKRRYTYHDMHFVADTDTERFVFVKEDSCALDSEE
ncbi:lysozyme inhibitor LprI family protein [Brucella pituitosa]|uniref:lysozyme inhibitor LprI family protein n=1 Tax=Brucella pituitosa TaxID=571256 RepID=UPI0012601A11|nr:hypothetical protein [Brucella pituitosa]